MGDASFPPVLRVAGTRHLFPIPCSLQSVVRRKTGQIRKKGVTRTFLAGEIVAT